MYMYTFQWVRKSYFTHRNPLSKTQKNLDRIFNFAMVVFWGNVFSHTAGADPGFPVGGDANPPGVPTYKFASFPQKLHEIKIILVCGGRGRGGACQGSTTVLWTTRNLCLWLKIILKENHLWTSQNSEFIPKLTVVKWLNVNPAKLKTRSRSV